MAEGVPWQLSQWLNLRKRLPLSQKLYLLAARFGSATIQWDCQF